MPEKDNIFSSKIKHTGLFNFSEFYKFCHAWLEDETGLTVIAEDSYSEKLSGDAKEIKVEWTGLKKVTDYFKFEVKVKMHIIGLKKVEIEQDGKKIETNKGSIEVSVKGTLIRDWQGKFETTAFRKWMRAIYEKFIIPSRVEQMEDKLAGDCDEFLGQAKAWLDLEGKR